MKKYLQLEGLVYKLVPIETDLGNDNPYLMGRIDSDLMYDIVMQWEWGNSESLDIYHDTETRKNSISFRSNMARLAETLINENKFGKAKVILDLGIEKMPLNYFGYYSLLVPFVDGYYRINEVDKAKELSQKIGEKYNDRLSYFKSLNANLQYSMGEEIITEIERYRVLVEADLKHGENIKLTPVLNQFMESFLPFKFLYGDYEFYTGLIDIAEGYFLDGKIELAQELTRKISAQYEERLGLYNQVSQDSQVQIIKRIQRELSGFNYVVQIVKSYDDTEFINEIESMFNKNLNLFSSILSEEE
jgi:tetratricopeptide (TPR) repeat protein